MTTSLPLRASNHPPRQPEKCARREAGDRAPGRGAGTNRRRPPSGAALQSPRRVARPAPSYPPERGDRMRTALAALAAATALSAPGRPADPPAEAPAARTHQLKPTPKTVAWGYYDAAAKPVL